MAIKFKLYICIGRPRVLHMTSSYALLDAIRARAQRCPYLYVMEMALEHPEVITSVVWRSLAKSVQRLKTSCVDFPYFSSFEMRLEFNPFYKDAVIL